MQHTTRHLTLTHVTAGGTETVISNERAAASNSEFARHGIARFWGCAAAQVDVTGVIDAHTNGIHTFEATGGFLWRERGTFRLRMERAA